MLRLLGKLNVTSVLIEGGGELLGAAFDAKLVDRAVFFYAPIVIGGRGAVSAVAGHGVRKVSGALKLLRDGGWRALRGGVIRFEGCGSAAR